MLNLRVDSADQCANYLEEEALLYSDSKDAPSRSTRVAQRRNSIIMSVCLTLNEVTKGAMFRGTEILHNYVVDCLWAKMHPVSILLHELIKLILGFCTEIP